MNDPSTLGEQVSDIDGQRLSVLTGLRLAQTIMHRISKEHGFWEDGEERNDGEMIALMHSELSEALEGLRHGNPVDDHIPPYKSVEVELADCIIRIMDYAVGKGHDVPGALWAKMMFNAGRPYKHGKKF